MLLDQSNVLQDKGIIKSSFMANSKATFETLDRFSEIYPDSIVSIGIKNLKNRDEHYNNWNEK